MDKSNPSNGTVMPGISIRHGPVQEVDTEMLDVNGVQANGAGPAKRKIRESMAKPSYAEAESTDDDDMPLV